MRQCEHCGDDFKPKRKEQRFCGGSCSAKASARARGQVGIVSQVCPGCGSNFNEYAGNERKYCSADCSNNARRTERPKCERCGEPVRTMSNRYCSKSCKSLSQDRAKLPGTFYERNADAVRAERRERYATDEGYRSKVLARVAAYKAHPDTQPCEHCGSPNADRHHEDYSRPLDVRWLCRKCHIDEHVRRLGTWGSGLGAKV